MTSPQRRTTGRSLALLAICAVALARVPAVRSAAADRPTDKDVKSLIERIDQDRDHFEDRLDGEFKNSIIRSPGHELNVKKHLDDLRENVDKIKDRFSSDYAASAEVTTLLRQASDIHRFMATQPPNFNGASEWNRLTTDLNQLAAAYATSFPLIDGQQARRMNDEEVRNAADEIKRQADRFKKELEDSLKKDAALDKDKPAREAALGQVETLKKDAEKLMDIIGDGRPASGEAQALLDQAATVRAASSGRALTPAAQSAWGSVEAGLDRVAQAFGVSSVR
jgi:hypothetical protein